MSRENLGIYLNDHLAGSVMAVELIERMLDVERNTELAKSLNAVLKEIEEDRGVLRSLIERVGEHEHAVKKAAAICGSNWVPMFEHAVKKAAAWLAEKAGRIKLDEGALGRLEMLETLTLGIEGKYQLWRALERVASRHPELAGVDYPGLEKRAREQHDMVEGHRLEAATLAL